LESVDYVLLLVLQQAFGLLFPENEQYCDCNSKNCKYFLLRHPLNSVSKSNNNTYKLTSN
jgi:hypothetical protein